MAEQYYKVSPKNPDTNWTTEVILERGDDGEVTKSAKVGEPVQLNEKDRETLDRLGFNVEDSSAAEAKEVAEQPQAAGSDISGASPVFGSSNEPDQTEGARPGKNR